MNRVERLYLFASSCMKSSIELIFYSFLWITIAFYSLGPLTLVAWLAMLVIGYSAYHFIFANKKSTYFNVITYIVLYSTLVLLTLHYILQANLNWISSVLIVAFTIFFLITGFRQYSLKFEHSFHITFMALSIVGHVMIQILKVVWLVDLQAISTILNVFGIGAVLITLFITNERMLVSQQQLLGKSTVLKQAVHLNRMVLSFISIVMISIVIFRSWQEQIEHYIKAFINWLLNLFAASEQQGEDESRLEAAMPQFDLGGEEIKEPSLLGKIIETIFTYAAYIALAILLIVVLFLLVRLIMNAVAKLLLFLKKRTGTNEAEQGLYIDEVEEIEKLAYTRKTRSKKKTNTNVKKWNGLTKHEKCTNLYTLFIKQLESSSGYEYMKHLTVKEQMAAIAKHEQLAITSSQLHKLTTIYEQAKYGVLQEEKIEATDDELNTFFTLFTAKKK